MAIFYSGEVPLDGIYAAYDQMVFAIGNAVPTGQITPAVEIEVWINGAKYGKSKFPTYISSSDVNTFTFYRWEFDPLPVIQDWFDNEVFLREADDIGYVENTSWQAEFQLRIYDWEEGASGKLERETTSLDSQLYTVLNATANVGEVRDFSNYFPLTSTQTQFLTNKPNRVRVGYDESEWLYFLAYGLTHAQVRIYGHDGVLRGQGLIPMVQQSLTAENVGSVAIGPANINAMQPSDWGVSSGNLTIDENVGFYLVQLGIGCQDGSLYGNSEIRRYYPVSSKERMYRLHFVNGFGTIDSFSVFHIASEQYRTESTSFQRPLPASVTTQTRESNRIQSTSRFTLSGNVQNADAPTVDFMRYFSRATNAWVQKNGLFWAITVEDSEFETIPQNRGLSNVEFSAQYSITQISQRN